MKDIVLHNLHIIDLPAKGDDRCIAILQKIRQIETQCDNILAMLSVEQRDILCDYLMLCESMSERKLEIACTYMRLL